ncbi:sigma-70 family RNA polymerase sigma factor [Streptomyces sp. NPDC097640]|uniref:sigma-70 family RNA polymerase sigma factor n=1 Tax=Streptomyces sp. NPDC097640 TaxID=3157229 RepID=UPI00332F0533
MTRGESEAERNVTALVRDAQAGYEQALSELISLHLPLIYNIIGRALNGHADVDDLVQETMERVVRGLPKLREPDRFRSWAVAIAYRQVQQHLRRRPAAPLHQHGEVPDVADPRADFAERTVTELVLDGQRRELAEAARWLEDTDRQLLSLWWQEASGQLTRTELASVLDVGPQHAAVRLQRMRGKLDAARGVVRALAATPRCAGLAELIRGWDGGVTSVWRKRLTRHTRDCAQCAGYRSGLVPSEKLLSGIGVVAVPVGTLDGLGPVLEAAAAAAAAVGRSVLDHLRNALHHLTAKTATATAAVAVAGTLTYAVWQSPMPESRGSSPDVSASPERRGGPTAPVITRKPSVSPSPRASGRRSPSAVTGFGGVSNADIYVAPTGSDSGDGTRRHPYATLNKAVSAVRPGGIIALRGGIYRPTEPVTITTNGTAADRITLSNYRGERPIIDAGGVPADKWMITQRTRYWIVQGLEIRNSASHAYVCSGCQHTVFRRLSLHDNTRSGLTLRDPDTIGNAVLDSDFFDNHGGTGVGVGLAVKFGSGADNIVRGCRAYGNSTDGIDLGEFTSPVTLESNWSYRNGSGFTFGGGARSAAINHVVRNNAAWDNRAFGFNDGDNTGLLVLLRNTAFRNGAAGFSLPDATVSASGNVSLGNERDDTFGTTATSSGNTWNGDGRNTGLFATTDPATAQAGRPADGGLPKTAFLTTGSGIGASMTE